MSYLYSEDEINVKYQLHINQAWHPCSQMWHWWCLSKRIYLTISKACLYLFLQVEKRRQEEKMRRDVLNDQYLDLLEKQRLYFKTVKEFKEECRKNEILLTRLRSG